MTVSSWALCALTGVISIVGLVWWQRFSGGRLLDLYVNAAQSMPAGIALLGGLLFLVLNGVIEDVVFFGVLLTALEGIFGRLAMPMVAVVFGAAHFFGVPTGIPGVLLAATWGCVLAFLRYRTGGMMATYGAHVIADATIVVVLLPSAIGL